MVKRSTSISIGSGGGGGGSIGMSGGNSGNSGTAAGGSTTIGNQKGSSTTTITTCGKCCYYFRQVITFLFSHIGLCTLLCGYALVGAFTFQALESMHEKEQRIEMRKSRDRLIRKLSLLTNESIILRREHWSQKARIILIEFEKEFLHAVKYKGYDGYEELSKTNSQWSFSGALLYSIIVITTIGYGNVAPRTEWGKVVTILYAIIGIPLMLFCLSNIGHMMARSFKFIYWKCCCYLCVQPKKQQRRRRRKRRQRQRRNRRLCRRQHQQQHAAIQATILAMNPLLLSQPQFLTTAQPSRISRSQSREEHQQQIRRPISHSSSSNALQLPQRNSTLSRSLSARYHNELRASKLRGAKLAAAQSNHQTNTNKIIPIRKTTVNMPPVICNQYASFSDERLDRALSAVHKPNVFRSSSIAEHNIRSIRKERPISSLQPPPRILIRQSASSSNLTCSPQHTSCQQRNAQSSTSSTLSNPQQKRIVKPSNIEISTIYNNNNQQTLNLPNEYHNDLNLNIDNLNNNNNNGNNDNSDNSDNSDDDDDDEEIQEKNIPITVCLALVISYICGGAWFFSTSEEWSFLDASYFCFITLSTIGFGDLVPGRTVLSTHEDGQMTLAICALYLLFGMALLAMSLNLVKEKVLETVRIVGERIGILVNEDDDDDDDDDEEDDDDVDVDVDVDNNEYYNNNDDDGNDDNCNIDDNNDYDSGLNICIHRD